MMPSESDIKRLCWEFQPCLVTAH